MFEDIKQDIRQMKPLIKYPFILIFFVIISVVVFVILSIILSITSFAIDAKRGEHYWPSRFDDSRNIKNYQDVCKRKNWHSEFNETIIYSCDIVGSGDPLLFSCGANIVTKRCPWRIGYIAFDKLTANSYKYSYNTNCDKRTIEYDKDFFRGEEVAIQEGCNDFIYYSLTPIKSGETKVIFDYDEHDAYPSTLLNVKTTDIIDSKE